MKTLEEFREWTKRHRKEIVLVSGSAVIVGGVAMIIHGKSVAKYQDALRIQAELIEEQTATIERIINQQDRILAMKEAKYLELASDALRHGSPQGGMILANHRAALSAA